MWLQMCIMPDIMRDFERSNVIGTQHVIDFCKDAGAVLQHTSTASVNGAGTVAQSNSECEVR